MKNKLWQTVFLIFILFFYVREMSVRGEDKIIAIVNDEVITESELKKSKIFPQKSVSFLIEKKLQIQTARKKGISVQPSEVSSAIDDIKRINSFLSDKEFEDALLNEGTLLDVYKRELDEQLTLIKLLNKEIKSRIVVNDKELEDYYLLNKRFFSRPEEIKIGYVYISVKTDDPAQIIQGAQNLISDVLVSLKNNVSFSDIKKLYSKNSEINIVEDPGFIKRGDILQDLDNVAFGLKEGEVSNIVNLPSGFYIIKVLEKKEVEYKPFLDVKEMVQEKLFQEKTETLFRDWIYNLKSSSYIEIKI